MMKELVHGGDIYSYFLNNSNRKVIDFSANINPLGIPNTVRQAIINSANECINYPDPLCRELRSAISRTDNIPSDYIFCGNGAADVLFRFALALRPLKAVIPVPTFSEYAASLVNTECQIKWHYLSEAEDFRLTDRILDDIDDETDVVYLCNPNNPTGNLIEVELLMKILNKCIEKGSFLLVDECFNDFIDEQNRYTLKKEIQVCENLVVLRAFTKLYAIPGVRLGYCMTSNEWIMEMLYKCGQPWNVSSIAQKCGIVALKDSNFPIITREFIKKQRKYLESELKALDFKVFESAANYILFKNNMIYNLKEKLEKHGILIRSCANYIGLDKSFFRIAVKSQSDNEYLISVLEKILQEKGEE